MSENKIFVGNIVTTSDGRRLRISRVNPDGTFESDPVTEAEVVKKEPEEIKDEKEESIKVEAAKEAPKKATAKRVIKKKI